MSYIYGWLITAPNQYQLSGGRDGLKNYYTYAYHIKNDDSYSNFKGMNYPYGDNIFFTDGHPLLSTLLKLCGDEASFTRTHSVGILNIILLLNVFLLFFVCYYLLKEFGVGKWVSLLFCLGMTLLSPQIFRMTGHFALSYSIALPLSWLFTVKFLKNKKRRDVLLLLLGTNLLWLFTHAYLGIICISFSLVIGVIDYFLENEGKLKGYLKLLSVLIVPVLLFLFVSKLSDSHTNRTDNPSGFFNYNAQIDDVFIAHHAPLRPVYDYITNNHVSLNFEAWSYIGLSTTLLFVYFVIRWLIQSVKNRKIEFQTVHLKEGKLKVSLLASLVLFVFALAIPFMLFPQLLEIIPFIKQFRSTGRFAWPFHFVALVISATIFQRFYEESKNNKRRILFTTLLLSAAFFNIIEGLPYHLEVGSFGTKDFNVLNYEMLSDEYQKSIKSIDSKKYQAIMTLPYYFQGSESFSRPSYDIPLEASMVLGYHTNLPVVNTNLGRTSIWENKNLVQLTSPNYYKKEVEKDFTDTRPLIIIKSNDPITQSETYIFSKCVLIKEGEFFSLYSLEVNELFKNNSKEIFQEFQDKRDELLNWKQFLVSNTSGFLYYNDFENLKSTKPFRDKGGFQSFKKGLNVYEEFAPGTFKMKQEYVLSLWMNNKEQDALNLWFRLILQSYNDETEEWEDLLTTFPEQAETIYGDWSLMEMPFNLENNSNKIRIITKGKDNSKASLYFDDLLIREKGVDVYKLYEDKKVLFYNNQEIHLTDN